MPRVIQVRWPAAPAAEQVESYLVEESVNGGAFVAKPPVLASASPLGLDINNPADGQYAYRVTPKNLAGSAVSASPAGSTPGLPSVMAAPTVTVVVL